MALFVGLGALSANNWNVKDTVKKPLGFTGLTNTAAEDRAQKKSDREQAAAVKKAQDATDAGIASANQAVTNAQAGVDKGLADANTNLSRLQTSADNFNLAMGGYASRAAANQTAFQNYLSNYANQAQGRLSQQEADYAKQMQQQQLANDKTTKMLEDQYKQVQGMRPDTKFYDQYQKQLSVLDQQLANDPYGKELEALYGGGKASAAELLLKKAQEEAMAQQLSMTASARGGVNYAALARTASNNIVTQNAKAAQDAAILRAQEQERWLGMLIENNRAKTGQQMQLQQMGLAAQGQQVGQEMQWQQAAQQAAGQSAQWTSSLGAQALDQARVGQGFLDAQNAIAGVQMQGQGVLQNYDQLGISALGAGQQATAGAATAGINLGTASAGIATQMGGLQMDAANMGMQGAYNMASLYGNLAQQRDARRQQDRQGRLAITSAGMNALGAGISTAVRAFGA